MNIRRQILDMLEPTEESGSASKLYGFAMSFVIMLSFLPLISKSHADVFLPLERFTFAVFIADYMLRLFTADLRMGQGAISFLRYPLGPLALCDMAAILSYLVTFTTLLRLLKFLRLFRVLKVFRIFKTLRIFKRIGMIIEVIKEQKSALLAVCILAVGYVFICASVVFNVEPETFPSFFDAIYWATVSLTTVGYGDIYPVSTAGRIITMLSSVFGIAVVALPSGIITAGFLDRIREDKDNPGIE